MHPVFLMKPNFDTLYSRSNLGSSSPGRTKAVIKPKLKGPNDTSLIPIQTCFGPGNKKAYAAFSWRNFLSLGTVPLSLLFNN